MEFYCRLCAEQKDFDQLIHLSNNKRVYDEIIEKLSFVNGNFINIINYDSPLPMTVCVKCHKSLNQTHKFISKLIKAQEVLSALFHCDKSFSFENSESQAALNNQESLQLKALIELSMDQEDNIHRDSNMQNLSANQTGDKSWANYGWKCLFCYTYFLSVDMLRSHSKEVHKKCAAFMCTDCKHFRKSLDFQSFIAHIKVHRKYLRNYCHYCNLKFMDAEKLGDHIKVHQPETHIPCNLCGELFDHTDSLNLHLEAYNKLPKKKPPNRRLVVYTKDELTCHLCQKVYKSPHTLKYHILKHSEHRKRDYSCDECGKTFFNLDGLKVHIGSHDRSNPQTCGVCKKVYNTIDCLKRHMRLHTRTRSKRYSCCRCEKAYFDKAGLAKHMMAHDNVRPHTCVVCNKSFMLEKQMRSHAEVHTGVKPHSCDECGKCFRLRRTLKAHKTIHTDMKPFECSYCGKRFRFNQYLKNHVYQHTGIKPYTCSECGMQFANWSNCNKHIKRRHSKDLADTKSVMDTIDRI